MMLDLVRTKIHDIGEDFEIKKTILAEEFNQLVLLEKNKIIQALDGELDSRLALLEARNDSSFLIHLFALWELKLPVILVSELLTEIERKNIFNFYKPDLYLEKASWKVEKQNNFYDLNGIALILLTSGTSGKPKGVKLSFEALRIKIEELKKEFQPFEIENSLNFLPMSFGHGLIANTLLPLFHSQNFYIIKSLDVKMVVQFNSIISNLQINFFSSVPFFWKLLIKSELSLKSNCSLKRVHCASADLSDELAFKISNSLPENCDFYNTFGLTELSAWVAFNKYTLNSNTNSFTFLKSVKTKLVNGELCLKAPFMFDGYFLWDEKNLDSEGYFLTGDLFEGNTFKGRKKEMVNKGGVKIFLAEVDQLILSSGMVEDVLSFKYILNTEEMLGVGLVLKPNTDINKIEEFVKKNISSSKWPNRYYIVNKIERNSRGKISREDFSKQFKQ